MLTATNILSIFFTHFQKKSSVETLIDYHYKAQCSKPKSTIEADLNDQLNNNSFKDTINITIISGTDQFTFESEKEIKDNDAFFSKWEDLVKNDADDNYTLSLSIIKKIQDTNAFFVYDFHALIQNFDSLTPLELISALSGVFEKAGSYVCFVCVENCQGFSTKSIRFANSIEEKNTFQYGTLNRPKLWDRLRGISHFSGISDCIAFPEDFEIVETGQLSQSLQNKFNQCILLLSLVIVFDLSSVIENDLSLKLNGYKTFTLSKKIDNLDISELETYYKIYTWMVSGGSLQDKAGLARNLISLNLGAAPNFTISATVYNSILSGYKVYERQNIKQYIDLRNKMSDQIIAFNEKATKIVDGFAGSFQKSALAVVSLYASLIIAKVLSSSNPIGGFTLGTTVISFVFLLISLIYFFVSRKDVREDRSRFVNAYENMKVRNEDLLEAGDIKRILNNDKEHKADLDYIDGKTKWYKLLWITLLATFALATIILFAINQYQQTI